MIQVLNAGKRPRNIKDAYPIILQIYLTDWFTWCASNFDVILR